MAEDILIPGNGDGYSQAGGGAQPPNAAGAGGDCASRGMVTTNITADGRPKTAPDGECVDGAEASRRMQLFDQNYPDTRGSNNNNPLGTGGTRPGSTTFNPGPVPQFTAPKFDFNEKFAYPSLQEAQNEPGFQFRLQQGLGALNNAKSAIGTLRGGATYKALNDYAQQFASQEYGNVANRALTGYLTRRDTAQNAWENLFRGSQAEYAPKLVGWQTNAQLGDAGVGREWQDYLRSKLSAADILAALGGY